MCAAGLVRRCRISNKQSFLPHERYFKKEYILIKNMKRGANEYRNYIDILVGSLKKYLKEYYELKEKKLGTLVSPVPLTPDEIKKNPPILLDLVTDGMILYDKNNSMRDWITNLKKRLEEKGARKIFLSSGKWYWDLKRQDRFQTDLKRELNSWRVFQAT